jgi:hypothetical protein
MPDPGLNSAIEGYREGLRVFSQGDPEPCASFFSGREDVTSPTRSDRHGAGPPPSGTPGWPSL